MKTNLFGGLMSSENMVEILMNMMQNPCPKHAQDHPHVVSSVRPRKKRFFPKTFNNSHSPICVVCSPLSCACHVLEERFYLARGITKPSDSSNAIFRAFTRLARSMPNFIYIIQNSKSLANTVPKLVYITQRLSICKNRANYSLHNSLSC